MAKKAAVVKEVSKKEAAPKVKASDLKKPKSFNGTNADWEAVSPAGKVYHLRKDQGLCVRCGKPAAKKKDGTPGLLCQTHSDYIKSFSANKDGEDTPKGKSTGKAAKAKASATPAGKKVIAKAKGKEKAYKQLGVKQLKDLNAEDEHMAAIAEEE